MLLTLTIKKPKFSKINCVPDEYTSHIASMCAHHTKMCNHQDIYVNMIEEKTFLKIKIKKTGNITCATDTSATSHAPP